MTVTIYDNTLETRLLDKYIGVTKKSNKYPNYSDERAGFGETVSQIKEQSKNYKKIEIYEIFKTEGKYSKFNYYFCFVPFDCDYVLVEGKKYKTQPGRIKTKKAGTVKFRIATFVAKKMLVSNYNEDTVAFYDTSGKVHRLPK